MQGNVRFTSRLGALIRACHPLPTVVVTVAATVLAAASGNSPGTTTLMAAAVFCGQLVVGWTNDRFDVQRDRRVGHPGKPLAAGAVPLPVVDVAIVIASGLTIVLSLLLGWRAGLLYIASVVSACLYNVTLKGTVVSWLPYAVGFGALPAVATFALPTHPAPAGWILVAAALVGAAGNFTNAVPVLADQPQSDVRGLPDRIGGRPSLLVGAALLAVAAALVTWAPPGPPNGWSWAGLAVTLALLAIGVPLLWNRTEGRAPFYALLLVAPVQLIVLVLTARPLH